MSDELSRVEKGAFSKVSAASPTTGETGGDVGRVSKRVPQVRMEGFCGMLGARINEQLWTVKSRESVEGGTKSQTVATRHLYFKILESIGY